MKRWLVVGAVMLCAVSHAGAPRSVVVGRTAHPVGAGNVELGLSAAAGVTSTSFTASLNVPGFGDLGTLRETDTTWSLPVAEGNATLGLSDTMDLNLHYSAAGLQPGLRILLSKGSPLTLSVMPEVGLGLAVVSSSQTLSQGSQSSTDKTSVSVSNLLLGARLLASHESGFYGALGYEHQRLSAGTQGLSAGIAYHTLGLAAGYELSRGHVRIRPEVVFAFSPSVGGFGAGAQGSLRGTELLFMPSVTLAFAAPLVRTEPAKGEP